MRTRHPRIQSAQWAALVVAGLAATAGAQNITQSLTLQPGWNAVWLEVRPANPSADSVFSGLPVAGVWTRAERLSSVDFIQNPSEAAYNEAGWLGWFPPSRPESFLKTLFAVQANRAYLIRSTNSLPVTWSVTGRPALRTPEWVPDAYNLRGLPVDPTAPPTFQNFFRHSKAHYNTVGGQLERIYRLNSATDQWELVTPSTPMAAGAAYWIYTRGASDYQAPLSVRVDSGDGLDYSLELTELNLRLRNRTTASLTAQVRNGGSGTILAYHQFNPTSGTQWPALPDPLAVSLPAGQETRLRLAARRQNQPDVRHQSILEVRDGAGTRLLVPVAVEKSLAGGGAFGPASGAPAGWAGLWVGSASLNSVSEPHSANRTNPTPTQLPLNLRVIVHVDSQGQARLLKEVLQMWRNGTHTNDAAGNRVVDKPGQYVLLTDDTLIPQFAGAAVRDGESVGRRLSTVGYDFPAAPSANFLSLSGQFAIGQILRGTLTLPLNDARSPFKHRYHPDHDNLNAQFAEPAAESFETSRRIEFELTASPPDGPNVPDYGYNALGGHYRETITGLHKQAIHVRGTFRLARVSFIAELNPSPIP